MEKKKSMYEVLKKYEVKAESIEDFCYRYHRRDCFHDRGEAYMEYDINDHKKEFERNGFTMIPTGTSTTGDIVTYYGNK